MLLLCHNIFLGFIVQTCITCFLGFWCFHVLHLFLSLAFPFGMKRLMESSSVRRNIHIVEVVIVVLLSLISPSLALVITEYQYDGYFCRPKSHSFLFYGVVLPGTVQFAIGLSLYLGAIWIIQRVCSLLFTYNNSSKRVYKMN